jgi:hypothetical protein
MNSAGRLEPPITLTHAEAEAIQVANTQIDRCRNDILLKNYMSGTI